MTRFPDQMLTDRQRLDWLRLIKSENVGAVSFQQLVNRYGSAAAALDALPELSRRGGLNRPLRIYPRDKAEAEIEAIGRLGGRLVAIGEAAYPPRLRQIDQAPPLICIKGDASWLEQPVVALVGARNASAAGRRFCRDIAVALGEAGFVIASGLARGIDTAAHETALERGTIAVIAGGLDSYYPPENRDLQDAIATQGLLVTEMTPGTRPRAELFPRRNRIIAGISLAVVVVEAALRSGSLITARLAAEQNREVFAVPGSPLDPRCAGANRLLRDGAQIVTSPGELAAELTDLNERMRSWPDEGFLARDDWPDIHLDIDEMPRDAVAGITALLGPSPVQLDDLIRESGLSASVVVQTLLELDLAGRIERHPGNMVSLR